MTGSTILLTLTIVWVTLLIFFVRFLRYGGLYKKTGGKTKKPKENIILAIKKHSFGKGQTLRLDKAEIVIVASCLKSWLKENENDKLGK
ncbi:hypothetical protein MNBD_NITROSPINAE01-507 [hydrothermal vent metagenome]|uniref:Uncharacterized protein n=1 Tax=hydrothermal vent metagenome TaxID=652676 RepID=A0A3B1CBW3_9ZZZZ